MTIEEQLTHNDYRIRRNAARCENFIPTLTQVEAGMNDPRASVRHVWAQQTNFTPTLTHIARGLVDAHRPVAQTWENRARPHFDAEAVRLSQIIGQPILFVDIWCGNVEYALENGERFSYNVTTREWTGGGII